MWAFNQLIHFAPGIPGAHCAHSITHRGILPVLMATLVELPIHNYEAIKKSKPFTFFLLSVAEVIKIH